MLLDRKHVHEANPFQVNDDVLELSLQLLRRAFYGLRLLQKPFDRPPPLALQPLLDQTDTARNFLALQLELVSPVHRFPLCAPKRPGYPFRFGQGLRDTGQECTPFLQQPLSLIPFAKKALRFLLALFLTLDRISDTSLQPRLLDVQIRQALFLSTTVARQISDALGHLFRFFLSASELNRKPCLLTAGLFPFVSGGCHFTSGKLAQITCAALLSEKPLPILLRSRGTLKSAGTSGPGTLKLSRQLVPMGIDAGSLIHVGRTLGARGPQLILGIEQSCPSFLHRGFRIRESQLFLFEGLP